MSCTVGNSLLMYNAVNFFCNHPELLDNTQQFKAYVQRSLFVRNSAYSIIGCLYVD